MKAIVAVSLNGVIGKNDEIPWNYSEDMKYFAHHTRGDCVVMGSNTFWSIWYHTVKRKTGLDKQAATSQFAHLQDIEILPGRQKIVLTRSEHTEEQIKRTHHAHEVLRTRSMSGGISMPHRLVAQLETMKNSEVENMWCIGGAVLYKTLAPVIEEWHVSLIPEFISEGEYEECTSFPWEALLHLNLERVSYHDSKSGQVRYFKFKRKD